MLKKIFWKKIGKIENIEFSEGKFHFKDDKETARIGVLNAEKNW